MEYNTYYYCAHCDHPVSPNVPFGDDSMFTCPACHTCSEEPTDRPNPFDSSSNCFSCGSEDTFISFLPRGGSTVSCDACGLQKLFPPAKGKQGAT